MRKSEREIKDFDEVEAIVKNATLMHLAMVDGDEPYVIALNYGYEPGRIYFHCAQQGRKLDLLVKNPKVAFAIETGISMITGDRPCKWSVNFSSVTGTGTASYIEDPDEKLHALKVLMAQHGGPTDNFSMTAVAKTGIVRIDIKELVGKKLQR